MTVGTPTITFKINALGQRVQKATTSATTDYHYDLAGHIIGEANDEYWREPTRVCLDGRPVAGPDRFIRQHFLCAFQSGKRTAEDNQQLHVDCLGL
jgi:hypothetical protein